MGFLKNSEIFEKYLNSSEKKKHLMWEKSWKKAHCVKT